MSEKKPTPAQRAAWRRLYAAAVVSNKAARETFESEIARRFPRCFAAGLMRKYPSYAGRPDRANIPPGMAFQSDGFGGAPAEIVEAYLAQAEPEPCPTLPAASQKPTTTDAATNSSSPP